jgi:hypothetical protein
VKITSTSTFAGDEKTPEEDHYRREIRFLEAKQQAFEEGSARWNELEAAKERWRRLLNG